MCAETKCKIFVSYALVDSYLLAMCHATESSCLFGLHRKTVHPVVHSVKSLDFDADVACLGATCKNL